MPTFLLYLLLFLLLLLILILFAPVSYSVTGTISEGTAIHAKIYYFFRLLRFFYVYKEKKSTIIVKIGPCKINLNNSDNSPNDSNKKIEAIESRVHKRSPFNNMSELSSLLTKLDINSIIALCILFIKKLFKRVKPRHFCLKGIVGFSDPCATGRFIGLYEAFAGVAGLRAAVDLYGDFSQKNLQLQLDAAGRFSLAGILGVVAWFCFQKPIRSLIMIMKGRLNERTSKRKFANNIF